MNKHVIMILANAYRPDPRVQREANGLTNAGHHVTIICWDRSAELTERELTDGIEIIRVHDVLSTYGSGWRQLFYLPRFWQRAIQIAVDLRPDIVHCHDLDTLYAGWRLKQRLKCKLVYDAHEHYPALMSLYLPKLLAQALVGWERWLQKSVDATITASTILADEFRVRGISPVITLGNFPDVEAYLHIDQEQADRGRSIMGVSHDQLLVGYIASFSRNRQLLPFIEAAALLPHVHFHIWGDGLQRPEVEGAVAQHANVAYHGWAKPNELPTLFTAVDIIYYALRVDYPGAVYNAPNTLAQAMAAGRPIIANDVGDLGRIVRTTDCGILLDDVTATSIADAVSQLEDRQMRIQLGGNGQRAAIETYNVNQLDDQLVQIYQSLYAG
ncbi:glycosyltransferase family 4 protein [Chloroflexi bacterium TSY]|nr:glycosyltransferase family 4 protein [Chloroflexi bacterium TSY]